jgi:protein-disulfide isomerase
MVGKDKFVLGLLVSVFAFLPVLAGNRVIGSYKPEIAPAPANNSEDALKKEPNKTEESNKPIETLEGPQISGVKEVVSITTDTTSTGGLKSGSSAGGLSDSQLQEKVTDILTKNPEIIVAALQKFQQNQQRAQQEKFEAQLMKYQTDISKDSSAIVLGKMDAGVKLVVFLDPNCPHCKSFSQALYTIRENFPNVAVLVRHWPFLENSEGVARGLWAINLQGSDKFEAAARAIATSKEGYTLPKLLAWVQEHKLDVAKFEKDVNSPATLQVIQETKKLAENVGLEGTPTSLLVDKKGIHHVMPTDEKGLESILKGAATA